MITLLLESHATSTDNERGIASSHRDVSLSRRGRSEGRALGQRYADRRIDVVYSSDLRRARDTAEIAFPRGGRVSVDPRLREWNYGEWTILIIGHNATRYALEHWIYGTPLADIVTIPGTDEPGRVYTFTDDILRRIVAGGPGGESKSDRSVS